MSSEAKLQHILSLVREYVEEKKAVKKDDWVRYSGPHYDSDEFAAGVECLLGDWLVFGKNARQFENEFSSYLGKRLGALTNSGSSANLLMVSALMSKTKCPTKYRLSKGDKVITPVVCFPTTVNPLLQNGLEPVFVDVDLPSLNLDLDSVEKVLEADTNREIKAIIFAHVLGNPPDMDRVMAIVNKYGLIFLEDSCDALGSTYDQKPLGSFGLMSTCSFYPAHHMTLGEGGYIATDDYALQKTLLSLRDWGRACFCNEKKPGDVTGQTACGNRFRCWLPSEKQLLYDHRYVFDEIGYNLKPLDLQAAMGLEQLKKLPMLEQARRNNFAKLQAIFHPYKEFFMLPEATPKSDPCWFAYMPIVKENSSFTKNMFVNYLEFNHVQTRPYFTGNLLYHPAYRNVGLHLPYGDLQKAFPNAHIASRGSVLLGTYIGMDDDNMAHIKATVDNFFRELR